MTVFDRYIEKLFKHRILLHCVYWLVVLCIYCIYAFGYNQPITVSVVLKLVYLPVQIIASYLFIYSQLPLLLNKKYIKFAASFILFTYPLYLLLHFNYDYGIGTYLSSWHQQHSIYSIFTDLEMYFRYMVDIYIVVFVTASIKIIKDHLNSRELVEALQSDMLHLEYNTLQSKIQPDLILNTLQHIKSTSIHDPEKTPAIIADLSAVLDDALYQSSTESRSLNIEINNLKTYLTLYATSSKKIEDIHLSTQISQNALSIRTLSLVNIIESVLNWIETGSEKSIIADILVLDEDSTLILQLNFSPMPTINIDQSGIAQILEVIYKNKYDIDIIDNYVQIRLIL